MWHGAFEATTALFGIVGQDREQAWVEEGWKGRLMNTLSTYPRLSDRLQPSTVVFPGGLVIGYTYSPFGQLQEIQARDPAGHQVFHRAYDYSPKGYLVGEVREHSEIVYQYDLVGQLTNVSEGSSSILAFSYDQAGNRLSSSVDGETWEYGANHQLERVGETSFTYDENGNISTIEKPGQTMALSTMLRTALFAWRKLKMDSVSWWLLTAMTPLVAVSGRKRYGEKTYFHYSIHGLAAEYASDGQLKVQYGQLPNQKRVRSPLFSAIDGRYFWYLSSPQGSIESLVDDGGSTQWSATYTPFGVPTVVERSIDHRIGFHGFYYDEETGFHYDGKLYYVPTLGRYLTRNQESRSLNQYVFSKNNPASWLSREHEVIPEAGCPL